MRKNPLHKAAAILALAALLCACNSSDTSSTGTGGAGTSSPTGTGAPTADTLAFSASNYSVAQGAGSVSIAVSRSGDTRAAASVEYSTLDGSAAGGTGYTAVSGTLQWGENDATPKTISVLIDNSMPFVGNQTFSVVLSAPTGSAQIATPGSAIVTIAGDGSITAGAVQFSASSYSVGQAAGTLTVTVNRTNGSGGAASVDYATSGGTALAGTDFSATSGTLSWAAGDAGSKTFLVAVSGAAPFSGSKTFTLALSQPSAGVTLGSIATAQVAIVGDASAPVGTLSLSAPSATIAQGAGTMTVTVQRAAGQNGAISVNYGASSGSAVAGTDFTLAGGTLHWANGDVASKTFTVGISNAKPFTGSKSFKVQLSNPAGGAVIGNPGTTTATIFGDAALPVGSLQLSAASYPVAQDDGTVTIGVERAGGSSGTVSASYATASGTAVAGRDFSGASGVLQWGDGDTSTKTFTVGINDATPFTGTKSFAVALSNASGGASLGGPSGATVAISGNAQTSAGALQLAAAGYAAAQGAGTVSVTVNRTGGSNGAVSAAYASSDGSAKAGTDYTAAGGTLSWADGDAASKTILIPISNAVPFSGSRAFGVALSSPSGGATLSTPSTTTVTIGGDARAPSGTVAFANAAYSVAQSAGTVTLSVGRTGGSSGAVTAAYATADGSAVGGTDFTATSGTLQWGDGDAAPKTVAVSIGNATPFAGTKTFSVTLSNPGGGAGLGTPGVGTVSIVGSGSSGSGGSNGPSAPTTLLVTGEGANSVSLSWSAAAPGSAPIAHYRIYRNSAAYATSTGTSYSDNGANGATNVALNSPANAYAYAVSAVDSQGVEGPQTANMTTLVYKDGVFSWPGDYSYSASIDYRDTGGGPESGPYDIAVRVTQQGGGFQPYAGNVVPTYDLEAGAFGFFSVDLKPTIDGQSWRLSMISRLPPGDVYPWGAVNLAAYGPAPVRGKWATYKVPLSALTLGKTTFTGSISGTTLTVSSVAGGVGVDAGGFITGPGVARGTYISGYNANGGAGTYTVYPAQSVSSTSMVEQRTAVYKFDIIDESGASTNLYYVDNVKFTTN